MTRHYVVFPSADPLRGVAFGRAWIAKGYRVLIGLDRSKFKGFFVPEGFDATPLSEPFPGYYQVIGDMVALAFNVCAADLVTVIGDDMLMLTHMAEQVAEMYFKRFPDGYGILQATGDRQGEIIDGEWNSMRICGSPTFGRGWYERAYELPGGFPPGYRSFYADEQLKNDAQKRGVLWREPSIVIDHVHWAFGRTFKQPYHEKAQLNWEADQKTFKARFGVPV